MAINLQVTTFNQAKDGNGGYHEIHEIHFLSSPEHALSTVKNILDTNIQYCDEDCELVRVEIECSDKDTHRCIKEFYDKYADDLQANVWLT